MTLSERMVEAAARAIAKTCGYEWNLLSNLGRAGYLDLARAALTAALAVAEAEGAGVFVVPGAADEEAEEAGVWEVSWNECRAATLAGRVTL